MVDGFYRIGQASKLLGVSSYHLRRLCEAGAIEAERTSGNQWRVPISEVAKLESEGVPPIPQQLSEDDTAVEEDLPFVSTPQSTRRVPEGLYAAPSAGVIDSAEEVAITENRLRKRRLERELEEQEDFFRERAAREAAALAAKREAARKEQDALRRRKWENDWITHALGSFPRDAPRELELEVHDQVSETLSKLQTDHSSMAVRRMVEAAVQKALAPWRFQLQQQRAIEAALESLSSDFRHRREFTDQKHEALRLAANAVRQCPPGTAFEVMRSSALLAIKPIANLAEHVQACKDVIAWIMVRGASLTQQEEAKSLVSAALAKLPQGCSRALMERTRDEALAPLVARIAEHEQVAALKAEELRRRKDAERRVDWQLRHVEDYLEEAYEYESSYAGIHKRFDEARRLKDKIRPTLVAECVTDAKLDGDDLRSRIEELVDEWI